MKKLIREFVIGFLIGIIVFIFHGAILYLNGNPWYNGGILDFFVDTQVFSIPLYLSNQFVFRYLLNKFGKEFWTLEKLTTTIFISLVVTIATIFVVRFVMITLFYGKSIVDFFASENASEYFLSIVITAIVLGFYYIIFYWKSKQEIKVKESKLIAGTASAKFDALKNQLDPHFLFNSLNVLASLIEENPRQAQKFTTSLSKVYRYVLEQKNKELVPLDEELAFARTYMNLIKMRFEDSITVSIPETSSNPEYKVVPLSLQLLLENAVKHNMVTPSKKLHIEILEEGNRLVVKNNIQTKQVIKKSSGVGLLNIKQRYHLLTDTDVRIDNDGLNFQVGIPMLTEYKHFVPKQEEYIEDKRYARAKAKVEKLKGFYIHLGIYCIMVPVFIFLNVRSTGFPWALFPILGWGWGVLGHAVDVFRWNPLFNKSWESRKINELMEDEDF